jgi:hypothetical protein
MVVHPCRNTTYLPYALNTSLLFEFTNQTGDVLQLLAGLPNDTMSKSYGDLSGNTFCGASEFFLFNASNNAALTAGTILNYESNGAITISSKTEGIFALYFYFKLQKWPTVQSSTSYLTVKFVHPCRNGTLNSVSLDTTNVKVYTN